jgi:hypothetical protein
MTLLSHLKIKTLEEMTPEEAVHASHLERRGGGNWGRLPGAGFPSLSGVGRGGQTDTQTWSMMK